MKRDVVWLHINFTLLNLFQIFLFVTGIRTTLNCAILAVWVFFLSTRPWQQRPWQFNSIFKRSYNDHEPSKYADVFQHKKGINTMTMTQLISWSFLGAKMHWPSHYNCSYMYSSTTYFCTPWHPSSFGDVWCHLEIFCCRFVMFVFLQVVIIYKSFIEA